MARVLSDGWPGGFQGVNVGIGDERSEIAAVRRGVYGHDVGMRTDVYDGCSKQRGIFMMLRAMSPKIIVTDEIGGEGDFSAIESAMNSGVRIIATAHGSSVEDIKARRVIANMIREGFFERYIILSGAKGPGTVEKIC
jgi:stage III sporulation protein AA